MALVWALGCALTAMFEGDEAVWAAWEAETSGAVQRRMSSGGGGKWTRPSAALGPRAGPLGPRAGPIWGCVQRNARGSRSQQFHVSYTDEERRNGTVKSKNREKMRHFRKKEASCEPTAQRPRMAQSRENHANFGSGNTHFVCMPGICRDIGCSIPLSSPTCGCGTAARRSAVAGYLLAVQAAISRQLPSAPRHHRPSARPWPARAGLRRPISQPWTGTGWRSAAERVTKLGWRVDTGGGGGCFTRGCGGGVENIIPRVLHSQPQTGLQAPPTQKADGHT